MSNLPKPNMSCHVTLASNSENLYFLSNSILNFRKSYQIWGKLAQQQPVKGRWKRPPSAYRVKLLVAVIEIKLNDFFVWAPSGGC